MKTIDFSYFIERYIAGEMNEAEKIWFRKELESNSKLRKEVALRKKTDEILENYDLVQLRNKLSEIEARRTAVTPVKNPRKTSTWKYAAAIAALVLLGSIGLLTTKPMTNEEVINKFYKPYETVSSSRSQEAFVSQDYARALEYYNIGDFRNAALYFGKVLNSDPKYIESTMYYGVAKYEEKNYPEAVQKFKIIVDDGKNLYMEDAHWYLALCYIQTNDKDLAINQLNLISKSESIYRKQAKTILRKMK
jgi:tetratricopeptide (TPR) repeat protein